MVKLISPFGSISAHGKMGGLVYETGRYGQYCKAHTPQRLKPTEKQFLQNYFFGIACDKWRELTDEQKAVWNSQASGTIYTGFNLFIRENIQHAWIAYYGVAEYGVGKYS